MPEYRLVFTKTALKDIKKIDSQTSRRIKKKIMFYIDSQKPFYFAEPLTKPADAGYRWRVGDYRVLFDEKDSLITILKVQHRREVYGK